MKLTCPPTIDETLDLQPQPSFRPPSLVREQSFDDFTMLASSVCGTPMAAFNLIDDRRQWYRSAVGLEAATLPRQLSFCAHAIMQRGVFVVEDATLDARFSANPMVKSGPGIRFYAGAPLRDDAGDTLGTLCVIDQTPRKLSGSRLAALQVIAAKAVIEIQYHRLSASLATAPVEIVAAPEFLPICCHCKSIRNHEDGRWENVENFIARNGETTFSHGVCDGCMETHYPTAFQTIRSRELLPTV